MWSIRVLPSFNIFGKKIEKNMHSLTDKEKYYNRLFYVKTDLDAIYFLKA